MASDARSSEVLEEAVDSPTATDETEAATKQMTSYCLLYANLMMNPTTSAKMANASVNAIPMNIVV